MDLILVILALLAVIVALGWFASVLAQAKRYRERKPRLDRVEEAEKKNELEAQRLIRTSELEVQRLNQIAEGVKIMAQQKSIGFPWLAEAYADHFHLQELKVADELEEKDRPAPRAAEKLRETSLKRRQAERELRVLRYQLLMYEKLFPWLADFKEEGIDDEVLRITDGRNEQDDEDDRALKWLTPEEYSRLPNSEKFQIALDRYRLNRRSKWEVGRDYERFVGYMYEKEGFDVSYHGIEEGLEDMGRDLICVKGQRVVIVQCKCWSSERQIHEKHIFQLFGSVRVYQMDHPDVTVTGHFVTSTRLSSRASLFANSLGIRIKEDFPLAHYPCIKCNVSPRGGDRIYHLPFDQQYDRTKIIKDKGEFYADTVEEAERRGFRRAFRYRGPVI
jgi:hypothetical protein